MNAPLLVVNDLKKHFPLSGGFFGATRFVYAVDGVSFDIDEGETLSLVGESGCGKSTVGRAILRLFDITAGQVVLDGQRIDNLSPGKLGPLRRKIQVVFQDPFSSLNPRMRVRDILAEPIRNFGLARSAAALNARLDDLMDKVGLPRDAVRRWPHEFSGGQRQRIGIARALAAEPELMICDEAVSALDVSVKAQIVNLLQDLQKELGLAMLFISHDLAVVEHITHRVAVMYLGQDRRDGAAPRALRHADASLYGGAAFGRCRCRTRTPGASASFSRATCRAPSIRPRAAASTPAAPTPSIAAARRSRRCARSESGHFAACHLHDRPAAENPILRRKAAAS